MKRTEPKYLRLRKALLNLMVQESWEPGHQLPFDGELIKMHGVSRNTVIQTIARLEKEGFVHRRQGKGTFYTGKRPKDLGRSFLIGVVIMPPTYIFADIIKGIDDVAQQWKYNIVLGNIQSYGKPEELAIEAIIRKGIDGLLYNPAMALVPDIRTWLKSIPIPVVLLNWTIDDPAISYVTPDDVAGGRIAADHMLDSGHRRIAFIGLEGHGPSQERMKGYADSLAARSIALDERLVRWIPRVDDAYGETRALLAAETDRPTAIIYINDNAALRGYAAIRDAGLRIPQDISVMGFDDSELAGAAIPPLTSVIHPKYNIGKWGAEILFDQIENPGARTAKHLTIEPSIAFRESVRKL